MFRRNPVRAMVGGIRGGIFLIGMAIAFFVGPFLPILFITLAITILLGSISSLKPNGFYSGIQGAVWMLGLAFCFVVGFWPWILVVCGVSAIVGALRAPIMAAILGMGIFGLTSLGSQQPQQTYQPYQPSHTPYQPYQRGYTPPQQYQQQSQTQPQYEHPQAQYPQEMPPQQMQ